MRSALDVLRAHYGYDALRAAQREAIDGVIGGRDVLLLMATGGGKSLCYILPPLMLGRVAVVVSPLVSLMHDQVMALEARGVRACYLGSSQADATVWERLATHSLIYVTPELASTARFRHALVDLDPCLLAVDEAHCVSEWGHDFRVDYRRLVELRALVRCPVLAVTATATAACRADIRAHLQLDDALELVTTVDRPNLAFEVRAKLGAPADAIAACLPPSGTTIVYVPTTREADEIARQLRARRDDVEADHAQKSPEERARVHRAFVADEARVVVATLAFGMGVDKPDVRLVVHWGATKTLEAYYQQAGRAGRDGDEARCVLFHAPADFVLMTKLSDDAAGVERVRAYCSDDICRRVHLARHFAEPDLPPCGKCDVCMTPTVDAAEVARRLLVAVDELGGRYGESTVVDFLRGSTRHEELRRLPSFGAGRERSALQWRKLVRACLDADLLAASPVVHSSGRTYLAIGTTASTARWLADPHATLAWRSAAPVAARAEDDEFARLQGVRARIARAHRLAPYMVCTNDTLRDLLSKRPTTRHGLLGVRGFGAVKAERYGDEFLRAL